MLLRRFVALLALLASVPALPPAAASSTVLVAEGTGQASFTFCPFNSLTLAMAATSDASGWSAQVALVNPYLPCVRGVPVLAMSGAWNPAAGGCLRGADLLLCFAPARPGDTVHWGICRAADPACTPYYEVYRGTATLVYA